MAMERQWPALPEPNPESLARWAAEITRLLRTGEIANGATISALDDLFLTPAEGDAAYVNVSGDVMTGELEIQAGSSVSGLDFLTVKPTDFGANKPQLSIFKGVVANRWQIALFDGTDNDGTLDLVSEFLTHNDIPVQEAGRQTIWVPSAAMVAPVGGASRSEITIGDHIISVLSFAPTGFETASFQIAMPKGWDLGPIGFEVVWRHGATATNFATVWQLAAYSFSNDDLLTTALADGTFVTDTGGTTNDLYISPEATLTIASHSPASGDVLFFRAARFGGDAADTLAIDAELIGFRLFYSTNAPNDF